MASQIKLSSFEFADFVERTIDGTQYAELVSQRETVPRPRTTQR
jgi:hypothetical protein